MTHRIIKDRNSNSYYIAGKGHSWGSFKTWSEANAFIKQVAEEDRAYKARQVARREQIRRDIAKRDADRQAYLAAQRESDRLLYEGEAT